MCEVFIEIGMREEAQWRKQGKIDERRRQQIC